MRKSLDLSGDADKREGSRASAAACLGAVRDAPWQVQPLFVGPNRR
jgi:hypothetical protein